MAKLSPQEIYQVARQAGFSPDQAVTMTAIALAESGGNTRAHNPRGEDSRGLWQINLDAHRGWAGNMDLFDPLTNARAAFRVSGGGANISPWTVTHSSKGAPYTRYAAAAQAAAQAAGEPARGVFTGSRGYGTTTAAGGAGGGPAPATPSEVSVPEDPRVRLLAERGITLQPGERIIGDVDREGFRVYATDLGNVYAPDGGFLGSYHSPSMQGAHNIADRRFERIEPTADGGYRLVSTTGEGYDFHSDFGQLEPEMRPAAQGWQSSPAYLAFLRQLGIEEADARASAASAIASQERRLTGLLPQIAENAAMGRRNLMGALEERGIVRSGETERRMAEARQAEANQVAGAQSATAEAIAGINADLAAQIASQQRRKAEMELALARDEQMNRGQIEAQRRQSELDRQARLAQIDAESRARLQAIQTQNAPWQEYLAEMRAGGVAAPGVAQVSVAPVEVPPAWAAPRPQQRQVTTTRTPGSSRTTTSRSTPTIPKVGKY